MELIYELSELYAKHIGVSPELGRLLYIQSLIQYQKEERRFHFVNEQNIPQFKLARSQRINEIIVDQTMKLVTDPTEEVRIFFVESIEKVFEIYLKKYASRPY